MRGDYFPNRTENMLAVAIQCVYFLVFYETCCLFGVNEIIIIIIIIIMLHTLTFCA